MVKRPASKMAGGAGSPSVSAMLQADIEQLMKKYEDVMMPADLAGKLAQAAQLTYETLVMRDRIRADPSVVSGNPKDRSLDNQSGRIAEEARVVSIHRAETATSFLVDACVQIQALQLRFRYSTRIMNKPGVPMQRLLDEPCTRVDFSVEGSNGLQPAVRLLHVAIYGRGTTPSENKIPMVVEDEEGDDEKGGGKNDGEQPVSEDGGDGEGDGEEGDEDGSIGDAGEGDLVSLSANMDALAFLCQVLGVDEDPQAMIAFLMSFPFVDDAWDVPEIVLGAICDDEEDGEDGEWEDVDDEEEEDEQA